MKFIKLLAYVGLASATGYIAYRLASRSDKYSYLTSAKDPRANLNETVSEQSRNDENRESPTNTPNVSTQLMYKNLNMTDQQREQYQHDYKIITEHWQNDNPNYDMNDDERNEYQDATLKAVLNEDQYGMYRENYKHKHP